ncbi:MAG TPA: hypothetical protein VNH18_10210 [Bryobacteraceae bacterium]|nr:hypothetical protein [Bryobacteraceae bacterium]
MAFENDLRQSLRKELPPPDFAAKVLARAAQLDARKVVVMPVWRRPAAWAIAAGVTLAAIIPAGIHEQRRRQEQKRLEAQRQLVLALNITRVQLQKTKQRLQKATRHAL